VGFAYGQVAKALDFHSKSAGSIPRQKVIFFILLSKGMKIFASPYFYAGNTMALIFSMKAFGKIEK
jgi:hypothetical protein